jgi:hypothetical protein
LCARANSNAQLAHNVKAQALSAFSRNNGRDFMAMRKTSSKKKTSSRGKKKGTRKSSRKKYGKKASAKVEANMHEMKRGSLRSGRSKKKVTSRKQAIAIGLSEARRAGGKVPPKKASSRRR